MADQKISDLTAIGGTLLASGDLFVLVDVSDTTMGASGTDKKITRDQLLRYGAGPYMYLANRVFS